MATIAPCPIHVWHMILKQMAKMTIEQNRLPRLQFFRLRPETRTTSYVTYLWDVVRVSVLRVKIWSRGRRFCAKIAENDNRSSPPPFHDECARTKSGGAYGPPPKTPKNLADKNGEPPKTRNRVELRKQNFRRKKKFKVKNKNTKATQVGNIRYRVLANPNTKKSRR